MKKIMTFMLIGFICLASLAQKEDKTEKSKNQPEIPVSVKEAFLKDYPNVKDASWESEKNDFEVEFKINGIENSVNYDKTGHRKEVEIAIKNNELPKAALDYISKNYMNYKLSEASKITNDKNVITYEAELKIDNNSLDLIFDENGKFLSKEDEEED